MTFIPWLKVFVVFGFEFHYLKYLHLFPIISKWGARYFRISQPVFTCAKSTMETPQKCVKSVLN